MRNLTLLNGSAANAGGYWTDRDGHKVYLCEGQPLPGCPRHPFQITFWKLDSEIPCPDHTSAPHN